VGGEGDVAIAVAVLDDYQGVAQAYADWSTVPGGADVHAFRDHIADPDDLVAALAPFPVVVAMRERTPFPRDVLERLPELKLLVTTGPVNAAIDVAAARERGVEVAGTGGLLSNTVELTWALLLALVKKLPQETAAVRSGRWQTVVGGDLAGRTLGLVGLGRIGGQMATIAAVFGMDVIAWSTNLDAAKAAEQGARYVAKDELFARADVVSIHLQLSERTRGIVGGAELAAMKPTAYLVNTSRGPIVDEEALAATLAAGTIAGAGLDTFGTEPLPAGHPFRMLPNVIATPHVGYVSERCYEIFWRDIVEDVAAWVAGAPVRPVR
jgi:phosphoglycerate dehydrogenase-like enzyme